MAGPASSDPDLAVARDGGVRDGVERFGDVAARFALVRPKRPEPLPVQIGRRRIYVLPTGFGLFLGAMLATMLVGGLNYNNNPALLQGARAHALIAGRVHVLPEDVQALFVEVAAHRLVPEAESSTRDALAASILAAVAVD